MLSTVSEEGVRVAVVMEGGEVGSWGEAVRVEGARLVAEGGVVVDLVVEVGPCSCDARVGGGEGGVGGAQGGEGGEGRPRRCGPIYVLVSSSAHPIYAPAPAGLLVRA